MLGAPCHRLAKGATTHAPFHPCIKTRIMAMGVAVPDIATGAVGASDAIRIRGAPPPATQACAVKLVAACLDSLTGGTDHDHGPPRPMYDTIAGATTIEG
ncbi:hypothetical protein EKO27_g6680 [Xylaria grammica]|uniref:Uncharacterized protein n=1 Tax=Xylaria grammica TaxID=363999 RepID=A0A439D1T8_9PEZI|nr:hypothetical protein EKO27_g6680 [Xylaria grammica]